MKLKIYTGADINCEELSEIFFFTIEEDTDGKYVHILGNICKNGDGEFMSADFVRLYMSISDFPVTSEAVLSEFMETTSSSVAYLGTMTKEEALEQGFIKLYGNMDKLKLMRKIVLKKNSL